MFTLHAAFVVLVVSSSCIFLYFYHCILNKVAENMLTLVVGKKGIVEISR